jgi:lysosomal acid lipase/cholesteryl ester hydrolase
MYDDDVHQPISVTSTRKYSKVAKYPTRNIKTPIVLVYGGSDSLVDIKVMLKELPPQTVATEIPHYEHLDFLWARDVDTQVFQHVFDALDSFTDAEHTKEEYDRYYVSRQESLLGSGYAYAQAQAHQGSESESSTLTPSLEGTNGIQPAPAPQPHRARETASGIPSPKNTTRHRVNYSIDKIEDPPATPTFQTEPAEPTEPPAGRESLEEGVQTPVAARVKAGVKRSGSVGSNISLDGMREGRGITIGASRAIGGVVTKSGASGTHGEGSPGRESGSEKKKNK